MRKKGHHPPSISSISQPFIHSRPHHKEKHSPDGLFDASGANAGDDSTMEKRRWRGQKLNFSNAGLTRAPHTDNTSSQKGIQFHEAIQNDCGCCLVFAEKSVSLYSTSPAHMLVQQQTHKFGFKMQHRWHGDISNRCCWVTNENNTTPFEWDHIKPIVLAANMSTVLW